MSYIQWTADFELGLKDIDKQHQELIEQINLLAQLHEQKESLQAAQALFDFIAAAMSHFSYEEEMLKEANYSLLEVRHNTHQNFIDRLLDYQQRCMDDISILNELLPQIEIWIKRHITLNDKSYLEVVKASGIYHQNKDGIWVRSGVDIEQQETDHNPDKSIKNQDDDAPKGWATGSY